jgi:hypothetical protein
MFHRASIITRAFNRRLPLFNPPWKRLAQFLRMRRIPHPKLSPLHSTSKCTSSRPSMVITISVSWICLCSCGSLSPPHSPAARPPLRLALQNAATASSRTSRAPSHQHSFHQPNARGHILATPHHHQEYSLAKLRARLQAWQVESLHRGTTEGRTSAAVRRHPPEFLSESTS